MATIIHLNLPPKAAAPVAMDDPPRQCEIVIFPGVRIEREEPRFSAEAHDPQPVDGTDNRRRPRKSS